MLSRSPGVLAQLLDVEFVRAKARPPAEAAAPRKGGDLRAVLAAEPALAEELAQAAMVADFEAAQRLIQQLAGKEPEAAARLTELLEGYRFDLLQELTQPPASAQHA